MNAPRPVSAGRIWIGVATLLAGTLLPPLDFFIVNLAIPAIQDDLGGGDMLGQQVVAAYAATYAVTLTLGGRIGDLHGRRRIFLTGLIGFALASLLCGLAPTPLVLVGGRILQGATAALMAPQSLALIRASLSERQQGIALGIHGATFGLAAVIGQSLGGFLVAADLYGLGWRTIFLINLPVAFLAAIGSMTLAGTRAAHGGRLDLLGALLLVAGLAGVVVPLVEGGALGWPWWCWLLPVCAAAFLVAFWRHQKRLERTTAPAGSRREVLPLVPPAAITAPGVRSALTSLLLFYALAAFFLLFSTYQQATGRSPFQAGLDILPLGIGFLIGPLTVHRLTRLIRHGIASLGLGIEAAGLLAFALLALSVGQTGWTAVPLAAIGFGQGLALPSLIRLAVTHVPRKYAGLASGLVNATLQISAAISVAVIGTAYFAIAGQHGQTPAIATACVLIAASLLVAAGLARRSETAPHSGRTQIPPTHRASAQ